MCSSSVSYSKGSTHDAIFGDKSLNHPALLKGHVVASFVFYDVCAL